MAYFECDPFRSFVFCSFLTFSSSSPLLPSELHYIFALAWPLPPHSIKLHIEMLSSPHCWLLPSVSPCSIGFEHYCLISHSSACSCLRTFFLLLPIHVFPSIPQPPYFMYTVAKPTESRQPRANILGFLVLFLVV